MGLVFLRFERVVTMQRLLQRLGIVQNRLWLGPSVEHNAVHRIGWRKIVHFFKLWYLIFISISISISICVLIIWFLIPGEEKEPEATASHS